MRNLASLCTTGLLIAGAASVQAEIADPVGLDSGRISGIAASEPGVRVYKGIPFAAPPIGDLRWREPRPVAAWRGVRDGGQFGNACIQPPGQGRLNIAAMEGSPPDQ
jgi:para-nitrobenzyl esterase